MSQLQKVMKNFNQTPNTGKNVKYFNRYGRIDQKLPELSLNQYLEEISQELASGEITQNEYDRRARMIHSKVPSLLMIAATNSMGRGIHPRLSRKQKKA